MSLIPEPVNPTLRKQHRQQRRQLSRYQQQLAATRLLKAVASDPVFLRARRIACYIPADGEIDTWPLMHRAWKWGKEVYIPCLHWQEKQLEFLRFDPATPCQANRFGLPEPRRGFRRKASLCSLDLAIVPLVAFRQNHRLGMGGGYYDRTLSRPCFKRPCLLGVAHHFQYEPRLEVQPWDIPMDRIIAV